MAKRLYMAAALVGVLAIAGIVVLLTSTGTNAGGEDNEGPITGSALERASEAALEHTGEGSVSETEVGDEESLYEVEVTLDDGSQVDVQLDEEFNVVGSETDEEDDEEGEDDDD